MTLEHDDISRRLKDAVAHVQPTLTGADLDRRLGRTGPVARPRAMPTVTTRPRAIAYAIAAAFVLVAGLGAAFATRTRPGSVGDTSTSASTTRPSPTTAGPDAAWVGGTEGITAEVASSVPSAVPSGMPAAAAAGGAESAPTGRDPDATALGAATPAASAAPVPAAEEEAAGSSSAPTWTPSARAPTTTGPITAAPTTTTPAPATTAPATTAPATRAPATTTPATTVPPAPLFVPNAGAVQSVYTIPAYAATVSSTTYTGTALVVTFAASGPADLVRPEGTCITVTGPGGATVVYRPSSVSLETDTAGAFAGTLTFEGLTPGTVDLQYGCFPGYSQARLGTLGAPGAPSAGTYGSTDGAQSIYAPNTAYRATFTTSSVTGGTLTVVFTANGPADLVRPEGTCLTITAANGTTRTLTPSTVLTTDAAGSYAGTFTYTGVTAGTFDLRYGCFSGYTQARIGVLAS